MKNIRIIAGLGLIVALAIGITVVFTTSTETSVAFKTHDDLLKDVGSRTSEFGGMYLSDDNNTLYIYMTSGIQNTQKRQDVRESIETVFSSDLTSGRNIEVVPAQYSISQLYNWYKQMLPSVGSNPHVTMTDLREGKNRIEIGVERLDTIPALEAALTNLNIPREAVHIAEVERGVFASHTIRKRATDDEMEGGYQIARSVPGGESHCTLGFNTVRGGVKGFVTAGHCTEGKDDWIGSEDNVEFYQPDTDDSANLIGEEMKDPPLVSTHEDCEGSDKCRFSDSAFIRLESGVDQNLGKIAKPVSVGSINVDHNSKYRIVSDSYSALENETVHYVGRTLGLRAGQVEGTCITAHYTNNRSILCQYEVDTTMAGGDSGAPVFRITNNPSTNDVRLLGIAIAKSMNGYTYSPIGSIYNELGRNVSWDSCDPSQNC
ncbi:MAG: hypothetical protein OXC95_04020 [Dehalococcoidia bacterium]|nr:hypothetical protein [Dehalococcoidia bacterium]